MRTVFLDFASLHPEDLNTQHLSDNLDAIEYWADSSSDQIAARLTDAEVAVVNKLHLRRADLEHAPRLKLICLAATGSDNVDLEAAKDLGIAVANIRDYCTPSVIQHVFALILTLTQKLDVHRKQVRDGAWQEARNFCLLDPCFAELHEKTLGLIGLGALGSGVAGVARAFGMRVVAARLPWRTTDSPSGSGQSAPRLPLDELLQQADIVSLHCPLTDDTRHIIDATALRLMQPHALLINTARGALIDSQALADALAQGDIGGAGIDVLPEEPPVNGDPLLDYLAAAERPQNLIVTPHIAWAAQESRQRALNQILKNIRAFVAGEARNRLC
jgi:glycerate dehydrogenase